MSFVLYIVDTEISQSPKVIEEKSVHLKLEKRKKPLISALKRFVSMNR